MSHKIVLVCEKKGEAFTDVFVEACKTLEANGFEVYVKMSLEDSRDLRMANERLERSELFDMTIPVEIDDL